jgi:hypothetical protein
MKPHPQVASHRYLTCLKIKNSDYFIAQWSRLMFLSKKSIALVLRTFFLVQSLAIVASGEATEPSANFNAIAIDSEASLQIDVVRTWSLSSGRQ